MENLIALAPVKLGDGRVLFKFEMSKNGTSSSVPFEIKSLSYSESKKRFLKAMERANLSVEYINSLDQYLEQFGRGREEWQVNIFNVEHLETWFCDRNEAPSTQSSNMGRLSSFFGYTTRRGWRFDNPCDQLEKIKVEIAIPKILYPSQARTLLRNCKESCIAFAALAMFEGLRPESELPDLTWEDNIDLKCGTVEIIESKTCRRLIKLHPTTIAWLEHVRIKRGPICPSYSTIRRFRKCVTEAMGVEWSQDILRHTAASYLIALHVDLGIVAARLGNSVKILRKHYHKPIRKELSDQFWSLIPKTIHLSLSPIKPLHTQLDLFSAP